MSSRWTRVIAVAFVVGTLVACGSSPTSAPAASLPERTIETGELTMKITPTIMDSSGAVFSVVLDTHSVELSMDLAASASLTVGETAWIDARWTGDGSGGHHRAGEIRFTAAGRAAGTATLRFSGFPTPVEATWVLGDG